MEQGLGQVLQGPARWQYIPDAWCQESIGRLSRKGPFGALNRYTLMNKERRFAMPQTAQSAVEEWFAAIGTAPDYKTMHFWAGSGQSTFDINFAGGYIAREHVKCFIREDATGRTVDVSLTFVTASRVTTTNPVPVGWTICIYRDTPKNAPLALFVDGAILNATNLDRNAKQSVFAVAELLDRFDATNSMAEEAILRSSEAMAAAQAAQAKATQAAADAATAQAAATSAQSSATAAAGSASNAAALAGTANTNSNHALDVANGIDGKATQAINTANAANSTANGIDAKATQAQTDAAQALATINNVASNVLLNDGSKPFYALKSKDQAPTPLSDGFSFYQWGSEFLAKWGNITTPIYRYAYNIFRFCVPIQVVNGSDSTKVYHEISGTSGTINNVGYHQISVALNQGTAPRFELHRNGSWATLQHIDSSGNHVLSTSNGAGSTTGTRALFPPDGRVLSNYALNSPFTYYGAAAFMGGERNPCGVGDLFRMISQSYNTGGTGGFTYSLDNYIGILRNGTTAADTAFVFGHTDGGSWTKYWRVHASGELYSPENANRWYIQPNGCFWGTGYGNKYIHEWASQSFAPISDARVKDITGPATKRALDIVEQFEFVEYDFKEEYKDDFGTEHIDIGVTVQQLMEINPVFGKAIATYRDDGSVLDETLSLHTVNLIALLLKSVAELNAEVNELKNARS
ncbi:putative tail fiber protein [Aeromonas phage LAh3]|nr:putative tail fiber protein [Aeromonas phage LAh3]QDH46429.1 putative tail fiber protein [Aeromonas phage LAh5]